MYALAKVRGGRCDVGSLILPVVELWGLITSCLARTGSTSAAEPSADHRFYLFKSKSSIQ